jgi:hypothetical protein
MCVPNDVAAQELAPSANEPGYIADHTGNGVFAGYGGIVGAKNMRAADRSLRKLVKMDGASGHQVRFARLYPN